MRLATVGHSAHRVKGTGREQPETTTAGGGFTAQLPKGSPIMTIKTFAPVFFAVAAAAIISAPVASASSADCDDDGLASVCSRNGHNAIYAEPRQTDPGVSVMMAPGGGPLPPLMAMD